MRHALAWLRLLFMWPSHRIIRLAPGLYLQVLRGTPDKEVAGTLAAAARNYLKGKAE